MDGRWVNSLEDLHEFISYMVAYAPDEFPEEDFLRPEEQLNLQSAFQEIFRGMDMVDHVLRDPIRAKKLRSMLDESLQAYREGDDVRGAHLLQEFEFDFFGPDSST
jgi:hypothetical protein